jgi:predicted CoA-substrate-specific enzyme activase
MIFAGIDIGSRAAKAIIMDGETIVSSAIIDTGPESAKTAYAVMETALKDTGISLADIQYTVATGYGRVLVPFADENISEISCHARGINWYFPSVRTILDMGGQDCKAINCDEDGVVTNFVMNDKCAGGTGRFLEMIADVLGVRLEDSGELALQSKNTILFNTVCAVFAKSDAIAYLRKGAAKSDILAGLNEAIATRSLNLLKRISIEKDFTITGGISKNKGMVRKLTERVGLEPRLCEDPQLVGALGAAVFAGERYAGSKTSPMKVQYGYSDGTGEYFITIDYNLCNGCGECAAKCPVGIFTMEKDGSSQPRATIEEVNRKKLGVLCPGSTACPLGKGADCQSICKANAITHGW